MRENVLQENNLGKDVWDKYFQSSCLPQTGGWDTQ